MNNGEQSVTLSFKVKGQGPGHSANVLLQTIGQREWILLFI